MAFFVIDGSNSCLILLFHSLCNFGFKFVGFQWFCLLSGFMLTCGCTGHAFERENQGIWPIGPFCAFFLLSSPLHMLYSPFIFYIHDSSNTKMITFLLCYTTVASNPLFGYEPNQAAAASSNDSKHVENINEDQKYRLPTLHLLYFSPNNCLTQQNASAS
jgi:hypothetical protein